VFFPLRDDNPREGFPVVTVGLIAVNVLVHIYQAMMSPELAQRFVSAAGAIPLEITTLTDIVRYPDHPPSIVPIPLTLLTSMFVHGGWIHLLSNMWYLWLFGDNIEESMGHLRFVLFYLVVGLAAAVLHAAVYSKSAVPMVGASGAIAGILGAYLLQFPRANVRCLLFIVVIVTFINVPAFIVLGFWFVIQLIQALTGHGSNVAWFAHIGGFVAGLLLIKLFVRSRSEPPRLDGRN
jgi:membrane associated rhomboid family serine protease